MRFHLLNSLDKCFDCEFDICPQKTLISFLENSNFGILSPRTLLCFCFLSSRKFHKLAQMVQSLVDCSKGNFLSSPDEIDENHSYNKNYNNSGPSSNIQSEMRLN